MRASTTVLCCLGSSAVAFAAGWFARPGAPGTEAPRRESVPTTPVEVETDAEPELTGRPTPSPAPLAPRPGVERRPATLEDWQRRVREATDVRAVRLVGGRLARLESTAGRDMALALLPTIDDPARRRTLLGAFRHHPHMPTLFDAGTRDPDVEVQRTAMAGLSRLLGWDVASDLPRYRRWRETHANATLDELIAEVVTTWVGELRRMSTKDLVQEEVRRRYFLKDLAREGPAAANAARAAGLLALLADWRADERLPEDLRAAGYAWLAYVGLSPEELRAITEPALADPGGTSAVLFEAACLLVGEARQEWAAPLLMRAYETTPRRADWWGISSALADMKAVQSVPTMIGVIVADGSYDSVYGVAVFGLGRMLGVDYAEAHDAAWWIEWWAQNRGRLPVSVRDLPIPQLRLSARSTDE